MKKENLNCKECGNDEFVLESNKCEFYKVEGEYLKFDEAGITREEPKAYCRKCLKEVDYELYFT